MAKKMSKKTMRADALLYAWYHFKRRGRNPSDILFTEGLDVLDDLERVRPNSVEARWYVDAINEKKRYQFNAFAREWRAKANFLAR